MNKKFGGFGILILLFIQTIQCQDVNENFRNFLRYSLQDFPSWIDTNGFDPTPAMAETLNFSVSTALFDLHGTFETVQVTGLSLEEYEFSVRDSDFLGSFIGVGYQPTGWAGITGRCNLSGMLLGSYPMQSQGEFFISSSELYLWPWIRFNISNGFISCWPSQNFNYELSMSSTNVSGQFEGLITNETKPYEEAILKAIADQLRGTFQQLRPRPGPVADYFAAFLQERFDVTPVQDIIAWPEPTTTTTTPTTPTTTTPTTTTPTTTTTTPTTITPSTTTTNYPSTENPCEIDGKQESDGLNNFLRNSLQNYADYLIRNGLDPTPPIIPSSRLDINSTFLNLQGWIWNAIGEGMSKSIWIGYVHSDFLVPQFDILFTLPNVTLKGEFEANGTIVSTYPISGTGSWEMRGISLEIDIRIEGFAIADGYIDISQFQQRTQLLDHHLTDDSAVLFPDLVTPDTAGGLGKEVLNVLAGTVPNLLKDTGRHPILKSVMDYLTHVFSTTPLTEIIGTTRPPGC